MKTIKITGGEYRGRYIKCPPGIIRPAMSRMREAIFSSIMPIYGMSFLDLFSGSAIMGLEALSRGAEYVVCVEKDRKKRRVIEENISKIDNRAVLKMMPVESYIESAVENFDIIYVDPPFPYKWKNDIIKKIANSNLISDDSLVIIHHPTYEELIRETGALKIEKEKHFGQSTVTFYRYMID
ncbi:16S rRNA (guanine(966)-N(2))-methyltransferase RsmD [Spirochaetia bacterium 38H-sp]|uniref:16S rRNA (Guanine(966)-N(2))-methyltransferase RsmD n=1 Tax=Rarispira pelagica TaxID=3141764 RepID=A0ABU9UD49_9SPIR